MSQIKIILHHMLLVIIVVFPGIYACSGTEDSLSLRADRRAFTDVTEEAGLKREKNSYAHCWGDINGDDLPDIFIINHVGSPSLIKNNGDGSFIDITSFSPTKRGGDLHGCAVGDFDNDGDQDIYVTEGAKRGKGTGSNRLYLNNGQGKFKDVASESGVKDPKGRGRSASWIDFDSDGYLDLFVMNGIREDALSVLFQNNRNGSFASVSHKAGLVIPDDTFEGNWVDYNSDGYMDLITVTMKKHLRGVIHFYTNTGGNFEKSHTFQGRTYAWGDYDNDGDLDLFVSTPPRLSIWRFELGGLSRLFRGSNKLYENIGGGKFRDISHTSKIENEMGGDKAIFFDYDNDGDLDIYLLVTGTRNRNINDIIFENNGDKTFRNVTKEIGLIQTFGGRGCGVAYADYNDDGFLDLFLTNGKWSFMGEEAGPYVLYENNGNNNHWIKIKLIGTKSNKDGIGAQIKLYAGSQLQYRQSTGGMEGYVQHGSLIHFGLGNDDSVDRLEILWPSGSVTNMTEIKADQTLVIKERENNT